MPFISMGELARLAILLVPEVHFPSAEEMKRGRDLVHFLLNGGRSEAYPGTGNTDQLTVGKFVAHQWEHDPSRNIAACAVCDKVQDTHNFSGSCPGPKQKDGENARHPVGPLLGSEVTAILDRDTRGVAVEAVQGHEGDTEHRDREEPPKGA